MTWCSNCGWDDRLPEDDHRAIAEGRMTILRHFHYPYVEPIPECSMCNKDKKCKICALHRLMGYPREQEYIWIDGYPLRRHIYV